MSILQEYEAIRRDLGEPRFQRIERFLKENPQYYLSDVYYKPAVFQLFEKEEERYIAEDPAKEESKKILLKEMIVIREWRPFLGGRVVYENGRVVELDAIPEVIDWKKIPLPDLPNPPGEIRDLDIKVGYFDVNDDVSKKEPLVRFELWDKELLKEEDIQKRIESLGTLLSAITKEGQVIWPIEFINEFTEKELQVCQRLLFKTPPQINQGAREENLDLSAIEEPAKGFRFEKSENLKEDIMKRLEEGIRPLFETERYKEYLKTAAKFHSYSFNNQLLIWLQCPEATRVAGFNKWKELGRVVNKGERGLKIIACGEKKNKEKDDAGNEKEFIQRYFFPATVFDVSQTTGKDIILSPFDDHRLDGTFERFEQCRDALIQVAGCPVIFDAIPGGADGYWNRSTKEIHIKESISQQATISTLVHEITHSRLHTDAKELKDRGAGRSTWEVEAESVSFIVCEQLGLDTSSESFGYIAGWSKDKDLPELKKSLELITKESQKLSGDILDVLEGKTIHQKKEDVLCQKR